MYQSFRLFDFNVYNKTSLSKVDMNTDDRDTDDRNDEGSVDNSEKHTDTKKFIIQMFGVNNNGKTCSILVEKFQPFFYVQLYDNWKQGDTIEFISQIKTEIGKYYSNSIADYEIVKRKKLYGFDGGKKHKFLLIKFTNLSAFNKVKNLWYEQYTDNEGKFRSKLKKQGYTYNNHALKLYESNIPPLLRYFHIKDISPSGWIGLPFKKSKRIFPKETTCDYEFCIDYNHIKPLNNKEDLVKYNMCSFDIEASSSHGDFPLPIKSYKKLALNIVNIWRQNIQNSEPNACLSPIEFLRKIIYTAFGFDNVPDVELVYPKKRITQDKIRDLFIKWIDRPVRDLIKSNDNSTITIEKAFEQMHSNIQESESSNLLNSNNYTNKSRQAKYQNNTQDTVLDLLNYIKGGTNAITAEQRDNILEELTITLDAIFPKLEGDKVTFIGSTFIKYGETSPYLNHCIVLGSCDNIPEIENTQIECYNTEREVLLAWTKLIRNIDPDIVLGYNICGFDFEFMFRRAQENRCEEEFLMLSRNKNELCANKNYKTGEIKIEESSIHIASGQHDLHYIKMNGRLVIDLYNLFRRNYNLTSYKLDYVSSNFIGDSVRSIDYDKGTNVTRIKSTNLEGLENGSYVRFEEIGHSTDVYLDGKKFIVFNVDKQTGIFDITGVAEPDMNKKVRWCLTKDDVSPQDIFRLTNGSDSDRAIVAKYCLQDCNILHNLMRKNDIMTDFIEMAKLCSVPINYLVLRGQGIKLTGYVAKKCREKGTLMPVVVKESGVSSYEGAIVLDPKCGLYLDKPVACVDYSSLYPSSMSSENISHDSKVWTKEYDLDGNLLKTTGLQTDNGVFIYDNLPNYQYIDIEYDTYEWRRKTPKSAATKHKCGKKICRYAQFPEGKAILPSILEELLAARKATRKLIPQQSDDFMKNVLDKRQLAIKLTANSLYGQCGASTSTFYEPDVAAATTATGRKLLIYAKTVIEEAYKNRLCETTNHGMVYTNAEYIYGDTDSVFFTFNLVDEEGNQIKDKKALEITIELAKQAGELATKFLKQPHDLEYEKTFMPFCLMAKKRYYGLLFEEDPNKGKQKSMGIVLKRRDNAPIVKDIYGGLIDIIMNEKNLPKAIQFLRKSLQDIVDGRVPMEKLIITKALRGHYKNPMQIAHCVLANRMGKRDSGNKPKIGDRIPYVYIYTGEKNPLQGDRIEHPDYICSNNIKIDYSFYISNQIMKPVLQIFVLVIEDIPEFRGKLGQYRRRKRCLYRLHKDDIKKYDEQLLKMQNKEVKALLFDEYLMQSENSKKGNQSIEKFFR